MPHATNDVTTTIRNGVSAQPPRPATTAAETESAWSPETIAGRSVAEDEREGSDDTGPGGMAAMWELTDAVVGGAVGPAAP